MGILRGIGEKSWRKCHLNWTLKIMINSSNQKREKRRGREAFQIETTTSA